jgi:glycosyltransferase involved in cell wall biosynthesis
MGRVRHVWIGADLPSTHVGGQRRHMLLHARGLEELGVRVTLGFAETCARTGLQNIDNRIPGARLLAGNLRELRRDPPAIINVHSACAPAFIVARRAGLLRSAVVVMSYAADQRGVHLFPPRPFGTPLRFLRMHVPMRLTMASADAIWCVSRQDVDYYILRYGVAPERVTFIPHAIEDSFFTPPDVPRNPRQIAFVGTWIYRKGNDVLSAAMQEIVRHTTDLKLVVAGTMGQEAEIRSAMSGVPPDRLRVDPRLDDTGLRALYAESALLVVPSRLEGMPFTMLEAMACGCPTLGASNSGMRDAIGDGFNGWLMDTFDPGAWAARIMALFATPERLRAASLHARERANAFRLRPLSEATLAWYETIAGR